MANKIVQLKDDDGNNLFPRVHLDSIYPVDSIYLSVSNTNPGTLFGGTWIQVSQGRALFGAGTLAYTHTVNGTSTTDNISYTAGENINPGMPNIAANVARVYSDYNKGNDGASGYGQFVTNPFYYDVNTEYGSSWNMESGSADATRNIQMDLSRSDSLYSNSVKTVQPAAFVVYMWRRIS